MTQVYNQNTHIGWDGKTNIARFMESISKYCDALVAFDDGSTDGSRDVITEWSGSIEIEIPSNKVNTPDKEGYHRARSLEHCRRLGADFVLCLDTDELFEKKVGSHLIHALCEGLDDSIDSIRFLTRHLWRTDRFARFDGHWGDPTEPRLFRLTDEVSYGQLDGIRSSLSPDGMIGNTLSPIKIMHFGYSSDAEIQYKHKRFESLGIDLTKHIDDSNIKLFESNTLMTELPVGPGIEVYRKRLELQNINS